MPNSALHRLDEALGSVVRSALPAALHELFRGLDSALSEQFLRAGSNQDAQALYEFQQFCKKHGERVIDTCCIAICQHLGTAGAEAPAEQQSVSEWSLVDDREVEDMLLARNLVRVLREALGVFEWRACACLSRLVGRYLPDADNPLSLEFLLRRLQDGLAMRERPVLIRSLFQGEVERALPEALRSYLQALAAQFEMQRVEPLPQPEVLMRSHCEPQVRQPDSADAVCQAIRRMRRTETPLSPSPGPAHDAGDVPLSEALAALQRQQAPASGWGAQQLLEQLQQQGCQLTPRQYEDTHLVSEVFEAFGQEAGLAPTLRPLLQRLLLPVLEATLREPAAIADSAHPVRATLDRLLRLCDYTEPPNKTLEAGVEDLVERILDEYQGDAEVFTRFDAELDELLSIQQRGYQRSAQRVMQLHRGHDILESAQREVALAMAAICGERVPKLLAQWLDSGWRDLLVNELIRSDDKKLSWRADLALTSLLVKRLQEASEGLAETDRAARVDEVDHLLQILRRRMGEFGAGHFQQASVLAELREQLLGMSPVELVEGPPLPPAAPPVPAQLHRWRERLEALQQGDWLLTEDGQPLQLIWRNPQMDHYVLVDDQGQEAGSFGVAELAGKLAEGALVVDGAGGEGEGLVHRTLQDMVGRLYREIAHARSHDELTGLPNRRSFEGALAQSLSAGDTPSFLMAHIDQFSLINGHAGPVAGDACLRQVANRLQMWLPTASCMARVGGVEFAVVLPACAEARAAELAEDLRAAIEAEGFAWNGHRHGLTLSIGVVEAAQRHDVANLFFDLQSACNDAKEAGRNRVQRFSEVADDGRVGLLAIAARVDDIVEREDLSLRVQQIAPTASDSPEPPHYELLLVMQNELPLQDFIAAAERYHRMTKVDRWVLRRIFSELERHPQLWQRCSGLSINLSGSSLNDDRLLGFIESLFERYAVDPRRICFELTETAAVANLAKTADLVRHLQRAGCSFSIDDFGVGFSSFDYLKRLPVDYVKIDGSFVKEIERSPSDLAMVRSINEIAHALGRRTVAEYVETPSIRARLAEMGVDYVQGFGVQKPRPLGDWLQAEEALLDPC
ncbi:DUF1631 family protein [Pseudomonas sp. MBLB4123]|uniref:DUF1631 family protein n=1 Tax=Pseudomonas sp. MBLB4123 TaxID=3451557 RepID=UPI003F74E880